MSMQIKASFKKEYLAFFRTKTFLIVALVVIGLSILSPLLITGLGAFIDSMSDLYDEYFDMDVSIMSEMLGSTASLGVTTTASDITGVGLIVYLLLINRAAGGEQKKRAVIIPMSSGLRSVAYIFPKFIIYPLSAFVLAVAAMFISWAVSVLVFDVNDVAFIGVLTAGILAGVSMMFYVCFHITIGTATGKAGMSAALCIIASVLLPNIFAMVNMEYMFNPFALNVLAGAFVTRTAIYGQELLDIAITIAFALAIMIGAYYIAVFAQNAKKIDNTGNEIEL